MSLVCVCVCVVRVCNMLLGLVILCACVSCLRMHVFCEYTYTLRDVHIRVDFLMLYMYTRGAVHMNTHACMRT